MPTKAEFDADFTRFVGELRKVDTGLAALIQHSDNAGKRLARMADSLQGDKLLEKAALSAAAIEKIGGVSQVTESQLRRLAPPIREAIEIAERRGHAVPDAFRKIAEAAKGAESAISATKSSLIGLGDIGGAIGQGLGIGVGMGALSVVTSGVSALRSQLSLVASEGQAFTQLTTAFTSLQGGVGAARGAVDDLRSSTRGLVTDMALVQASNKASLLGLGEMGIRTDELADIAVRLGRAMGHGAAKSVDDLTTALARQSPQILDNLGIKMNLSEATERYAASLDKTADALTDDEKKLAFATAAMDAARAKAATLGEATLHLGDQFDRIGVTLSNARAGVGAFGNESGVASTLVGAFADQLDNLMDAMSDVRRGVTDLVAGPIGGLVGTFTEAAQSSWMLTEGLKFGVSPALGLLKLQLLGVQNLLNTLSTIKGVVTGDLWDVNISASGRDRLLLDPTMGQGKRARDYLDAYEKKRAEDHRKAQEQAFAQLDAAFVRRAEGENKALVRAAEERTRILGELTGRTTLASTMQRLDLARVAGFDRLVSSQAAKLFDDLFDAREIARVVAPNLADGLTDAMNALSTHPGAQQAAKNVLTKLIPARSLNMGPYLQDMINAQTRRLVEDNRDFLGRTAGFGGPISSTNPLADHLVGLAPALERTTTQFRGLTARTRDWRAALGDTSQAFAQLAQVSGGLDPVTRQIGMFVSGLQAAEQLVRSIGTTLNRDFRFGSSARGQSAAAGLAGGFLGFDLGQHFGRTGGALAGAGGGALAGVPFAKVTGGASIAVGALVGGIAGYFGGRAKESELRKLKDLQADQLVAQYGSLQELLVTVDRLGMNTSRFLDRFYGEPKEFAKGVNELTVALQREQQAAEALGTALEVVSRRQGVLSAQQARDLAGVRPGSPGEGMARAFAEQQRELAGAGLGLAGSAFTRLTAASDRELADIRRDVDRLFADVRDPEDRRSRSDQETEARLTALQADKATSVLDRFGSAAGGMAAGLSLQFQSMLDQGYSTAEALAAIREPASQLDAILARAGRDGGAAFAELRGILAIANDEALAPALDLGIGLGKVLAGLGNQGGLTGEAFTQLAGGVAESYYEMERMGQGGVNAVRALRDPLQTIWQLQQDFGFEVDESTQRVLDFAWQSSQIGDAFRPAEEKMLLGLSHIVDRLDTIIGMWSGELVTEATAGAELAGRNILDEFSRIRPVIPIKFEWQLPDIPATPPGAPRDPARTSGGAGVDAVRAAAGSRELAVNMDGERVAYIVTRHQGNAVYDTAGV